MAAGKGDRLWAEAMNCAGEMSNRCTTTFLNPGVSPYGFWVGHRPTFDNLIPFGTVGYLRQPKPENKLALRGAKCIMLGIDTNYPRRTFRVRDLTTGRVIMCQAIMCQAIILRPTAGAGETVSRNTATRGGRGDTGITHRDPRKSPTTRPHWGAGRPSRRSRNRNSISRWGRVGRKVHFR